MSPRAYLSQPFGISSIPAEGSTPTAPAPAQGALGPVPTGTPVTDTAAVQAYFNAAAAAGRTAVLTQPGAFEYSAPIIVKGSFTTGGTTQTHRASTTFPATEPLFQSTPATSLTTVVFSFGGALFDANGRASHCLWFPNVNHNNWFGRPNVRNATQHTVVLGTPTAVTQSGGFHLPDGIHHGRSSGHAQPAGYALLVVAAHDSDIGIVGGKGQETGIWNLGANNTFQGCHPTNPKVLQGFADTGVAARIIACIGDTFGPVHHAATGTNGSSVLTDAAIKKIHLGIRIVTASGAGTTTAGHIPAMSFIGTITTGTSFHVVNATGTAVNLAAGASVTKVKLVATHFNARGKDGQLGFILAQSNNQTTTAAKTADAFNFGPSTGTRPYTVGPAYIWAHSAGLAFANAMVGKWQKQKIVGPIIQTHVTNPCPAVSFATALPITTQVTPKPATATFTAATLKTLGCAKATTPSTYTVKAGTKLKVTALVQAESSAAATLKMKLVGANSAVHAAPTHGAAVTAAWTTSKQGLVSQYAPTANKFFGVVLNMEMTVTAGETVWVDIAGEVNATGDTTTVNTANLVFEFVESN